MVHPKQPDLPICAVLPELGAALQSHNNLVLIAPPGAGKTTMVAPQLITQPWADGTIILLSPRRVAARSAAEHMARLAGEKVGETFGYAVRMDRKIGPDTRVEVMTEGLYLQKLQNDPELTGVSAVLFDEVHERSLNCDFALALTLEAQNVFRPDLKVIAMSATLDGRRFADLLDGAPVIESEGRIFPLQERYIGRRPDERLPSAMAKAVHQALEDEEGADAGDILCFLPGAADIRQLQTRLEDSLDNDILICPLYGTQSLAEQRHALTPAPDGNRKVILATNIAETSLTIDGVRIVIDSGMARKAVFDNKIGDAVLLTQRISQASATQRAGRAARQRPGVVYRLWEKAATAGFPPFDIPEILQSDLADLTLQCAIWGENDPRQLRWLDPPTDAALAAARQQLAAFGAIDDTYALTDHGRKIAQMPLPPALAHMLLIGAQHGQERIAARLALLLQERNLGGNAIDLAMRLDNFARSNVQRDKQADKMTQGWAKQAREHAGKAIKAPLPLGMLLAKAFPDKLARRRDQSGQDWISAGGRAYRLYDSGTFPNAAWLAIANVYGQKGAAMIGAAIAVDAGDIEQHCSDIIKRRRTAHYDKKQDRVFAEEQLHLGAIIMAKQNVTAQPDDIISCLLEHLAQHGLDNLPWSKSAISLRQRAQFCDVDILNDEALKTSLDEWLAPLLAHVRGLADIAPDALYGALQTLLGWDLQQHIAQKAPQNFTSPAGSTHMIDYAAEAGPTVNLRVQALYGLAQHPHVGQPPVPLVLELTSPAGRTIQTTRDLPAFWQGSWHDVAKDMRGRYPRHVWPDDPTQAVPSLKTRNAQARAAK